MSITLMQTALLLPLELMINGMLALDTASKARLLNLAGRTLALHATQPKATLYISVRGSGLHLSTIHEGATTASLHGPVSALLGLLLRREPVANLRSRNVELRGDTGFVQELQALLLELDIDWEYHLGKLVGDVPTQSLADGLRAAGALLRNTASRLRENVSDYLHEEADLLPTVADLETYYRDVADLKLRADRLQARIERLTATHD